MRAPCLVLGCARRSRGRGLCGPHYMEAWRGLRAFGPAVERRLFCSVRGCGRKHLAKGFCSMHYRRQKDGLPMLAGPMRAWSVGRPIHGPECVVAGCDRGSAGGARGMCGTHYQRILNSEKRANGAQREDVRSRQRSAIRECHKCKRDIEPGRRKWCRACAPAQMLIYRQAWLDTNRERMNGLSLERQRLARKGPKGDRIRELRRNSYTRNRARVLAWRKSRMVALSALAYMHHLGLSAGDCPPAMRAAIETMQAINRELKKGKSK